MCQKYVKNYIQDHLYNYIFKVINIYKLYKKINK